MTFVFKHPSKYKKEKLENQKDKPIEQKDIQVNVERLKHLGLIKELHLDTLLLFSLPFEE